MSDLEQRDVKVQFNTNDESLSIAETSRSVLVKSNLRRGQLTALVHYLREKPDDTTPLDFLINGNLLRTSIEAFLTSTGLSTETTLTIDYSPALRSPSRVTTLPHDDWLSSVDLFSASSPSGQWASHPPASGQERILTSSFDGSLKVWNTSQKVLASTAAVEDRGSRMAVKSAKFISSSQIVSAGYDRTLRVWKYEEDGQRAAASLIPQVEYYGHSMFINRIAVHTPSKKMLSASDDRLVGLWTMDAADAPAAPRELCPQGGKRRKTDSGDGAQLQQKGALSLMKSHNGSVRGVIFDPNDYTVGCSVSEDHTLKVWDLTTAALVDTRTTSNSLHSVTALPQRGLLAAGNDKFNIVVIDPRASAARAVTMTLRGHRSIPSCLAADPNDGNRLLSGSYDGTCRVWDLRATRQGNEGAVGESVLQIKRPGATQFGSKVFDCHWDRELGILSVGEDKQLQINRSD